MFAAPSTRRVVERISADAAETRKDQQAATSDSDERSAISPYKAIVQLKEQTLASRGSEWPLTPGMQVVAEMKEGERTVVEYLLSPVRKALQESARER